MNAILRRFPSPALIVACVSLVLALGGVSYAAVLGANSVGSKQIRANAVTGAKVKPRTLTASDLKPSAVARLRGGKGDKGDPGPAGPPGPPGEPGPVTPATISDVPAVRVSLGSDHSVADNTSLLIPFGEEAYDTAGMHDLAQPTRLVAPIPGVYAVSATVNWDSDSDGGRWVQLQRNLNYNVAAAIIRAAPTSSTLENVTGYARFNAGDFLAVRAQPIMAGNAVAVRGAYAESTVASMTWVAP